MGVRILLVEDHVVMREGLRGLISQQADMEVVGEAGDGNEAVELARRLKPDIIIMDVRMQGMDGVEATQRIKAFEGTNRIPVIALTANAMRGDRERFIAAGCDDYLPKPISTTDLLNLIGEHLHET